MYKKVSLSNRKQTKKGEGNPNQAAKYRCWHIVVIVIIAYIIAGHLLPNGSTGIPHRKSTVLIGNID